MIKKIEVRTYEEILSCLMLWLLEERERLCTKQTLVALSQHDVAVDTLLAVTRRRVTRASRAVYLSYSICHDAISHQTKSAMTHMRVTSSCDIAYRSTWNIKC